MKSEPKAFASLSSGLLARKGAARPAMRPQGFGQSGNGLEDLGWNDMGFEAPRAALTPAFGQGDELPQVARNPLGLTPLASPEDECSEGAPSPVHHQQAEIVERLHHSEVSEAEEVADETVEPVVAATEQVSEEEHDDMLELADELPEAMPLRSPVLTLVPAPVEEVVAQLEPPQVEPPQMVEDVVPKPSRAAPVRRSARRGEVAPKGKAAFTLRLDPGRHLKLRLACAVNAKSAQQLVTKALDELLASMPELEAMASKAPEQASRKGQA